MLPTLAQVLTSDDDVRCGTLADLEAHKERVSVGSAGAKVWAFRRSWGS